jgi:hypothetical protein
MMGQRGWPCAEVTIDGQVGRWVPHDKEQILSISPGEYVDVIYIYIYNWSISLEM